jgi:lipopolysaccharide export system permease protein
MFSPLFIFISVIFFTSKLAGNSEVIAILASGVSYHRFILPYAISATLLFVMSFILTGYIIPPASEKMLTFQDKYIQRFTRENARNIQMEVEPGTILYIESFQKKSQVGYRASLEHFEGKKLTMRIIADRITYDSAYNWHLDKYIRRDFDGMYETLSRGDRLDTIIPILPKELFYTAENAQMMPNPELKEYIDRQRQRGSGNVQAFETEWWKRWASPIGAFIMTLLGVTLSSKKVRGGMGKNLGIGITLSALYILFSTVSTTFSVNGVMSPFMSVWIPNFVFLGIGIFLYIRVSK